MSAVARLDSRTAAEEYALSWAEPADLNARCVIYLIVCWATGKGYVGQTRGLLKYRFETHFLNAFKKMQKHLFAKAIRKHGASNFDVFILDRCSSIDELNAREKFWISQLETMVPIGYNLQDGGDAPGFKMAAEVGAKISKKLKGRTVTWGDKVAAALRGRKSQPRGPWSVERRESHRRRMALVPREKFVPSVVTIEARRSKMVGRVWATDGTTSKMFQPQQIPIGWRLGRVKRPMIWITNGVETRYVDEREPIPAGWSRGRHAIYVPTQEARAKRSASMLLTLARKRGERDGSNENN